MSKSRIGSPTDPFGPVHVHVSGDWAFANMLRTLAEAAGMSMSAYARYAVQNAPAPPPRAAAPAPSPDAPRRRPGRPPMGEKARELSWARAELRKAEKAAWGAAIDDPQGFLRWAVVTAKARVAKIEGEMGAAATDNDPT